MLSVMKVLITNQQVIDASIEISSTTGVARGLGPRKFRFLIVCWVFYMRIARQLLLMPVCAVITTTVTWLRFSQFYAIMFKELNT